MLTSLLFGSTTSCSVTLVSWLGWLVQQFQGASCHPSIVSVGSSQQVEEFCVEVIDLQPSISTWGCLPISLPPTLLALPAVTQSNEWQLSSFGSLSASINGYRCHPSALCTCPSRGPQPKHFTWSLHPSSVDAPVDIHNPNHNFPYFHPWEAFLVGHWVTTLPFCSCGIIPASPPKEVVL